MHTCHHLSPQLPMLCCPHFWMRKWGCSEAPRHTVTAHHWQRQGASWPPWVEAAHSTLCPFPVDRGPCQPKSKDQMIPVVRPLNCGEKIRPHLNSRGHPQVLFGTHCHLLASLCCHLSCLIFLVILQGTYVCSFPKVSGSTYKL